ncbi:MAG: MBL fold metallo-hydrolase [Lachnospiraceae bacterium]|nr:MBL fold metallo-hydrolase [Lachnospiraceae bacterium]
MVKKENNKKQNILKKLLIIFLAGVLSLSFAACDGNKENPDPSGTPEVSPTENDDGNQTSHEGDTMKVVFFEIGKADAFLIYNSGATLLIDTGEPEAAEDILKYMDKKGLGTIDYLFITHFDKDHVGGASRIIENIDVKQVYTSNYPKSSGEYDNFKSAVNKKKVPASVLREDSTFEIAGMTIEVDAPLQDVYDDDPSNNSSLIIRIAYGEKSFLFMADAKGERIKEYNGTDPKGCTVIKMPYHGKYVPGLDDLLKKTQPKYAVITSSKDEKEAEETNQTLKDHNVQIYKTRKGRVIIETDGKDISVTQK